MNRILSLYYWALIVTLSCVGSAANANAQESRGPAALATQVSTLRSAVASMSSALRADVAALQSDVTGIRALVDRQKRCGDQKAVYGPSHADADNYGCVKLDEGLRLGSSFEASTSCAELRLTGTMHPVGLAVRNNKLVMRYASNNAPGPYNGAYATNCSRDFDGSSWSACTCSREHNWR